MKVHGWRMSILGVVVTKCKGLWNDKAHLHLKVTCRSCRCTRKTKGKPR